MTKTQFAQSHDGTRIAYDINECMCQKEDAPSLLLVHGYSDNRQLNWHATGCVEQLRSNFRVITLDLRGCGESDSYTDTNRYRLEDYIADILAVMDAVNLNKYLYWGWSFGATLGLHLAAQHSQRISRLVVAGTAFGQVFTPSMVKPVIELWEQLVTIKETGDYEKIAPEEREYLQQIDATAVLTRWQATLLHSYSGVEPDNLKVPTLMITGTEDVHVFSELERYRENMIQAGIEFHVFKDMNHHGLITDVELVLSVVQPFLLRN